MKRIQGFTLIEVVVALGAFGVVMFGLILSFTLIIRTSRDHQNRTQALAVANERIEAIRNMPYDDVGVEGGIPSGVLPNYETIIRGTSELTVLYDVRYTDDPFDGTFENGDTLPADYKTVRVEVGFSSFSYKNNTSMVLVTTVAPPGLETEAGGGNLLIEVFDSLNQPLQGATVKIENYAVDPDINVVGLTNVDGQYFVMAAPVSTEKYEITVTKDAFSASKTYAPSPSNPNPNPAPLSVFEAQLTSKSFFIDQLGTLTIKSYDDSTLSNSWWNSNYHYQVPLVVTNTGTENLPEGTALSMTFDHAAFVSGSQSLSNGADVRVLQKDGSTFHELDRIASQSGWNSATTTVWFQLQKPLDVAAVTNEYAIYYGNPAAVSPPETWTEIFSPNAADQVAVWYAEDTAGLQLTDSSSGAHHGALVSMDASAWTAGKHAGGIRFDGVDDCVTVPNHEDLTPSGSFTIETWVRPEAATTSGTIIEKSNGALPMYQLGIQDIAGLKFFQVTYEDSGLAVTLTHPDALPIDTWTHVAAVLDTAGMTVTLYVNNVASVPTPIVAEPQEITTDVTIGCDAQSRRFLGTMDALAISHVAKTSFPSTNQTFQLTLEPQETFSIGNSLANIDLILTGVKSIGTDQLGKPIPKTVLDMTTSGSGSVTLEDLEYDTYNITSDGSVNGWDIAATSPHLPLGFSAGANETQYVFLAEHSDHTLRVSVQDAQGAPIVGASVRLEHALSGYDVTVPTGFTGQSFFSDLSQQTYTATISAEGYASDTFPIDVLGQTIQTIQLAES